MPYVRNWLHCVWGTKRRISFLSSSKKNEIISHIVTNAVAKGLYIDALNGHDQHFHCLLQLGHDQPLSEAIHLLKCESSYWMSKNKIIKGKFEWAAEYYATSVSESQLIHVRDYIKSQEQHHASKTWEEEYNEFIDSLEFRVLT